MKQAEQGIIGLELGDSVTHCCTSCSYNRQLFIINI